MAQNWRDEWRCASTIPGVQCVMTCGMTEMHMWSADSWGCPVQVSSVTPDYHSIATIYWL